MLLNISILEWVGYLGSVVVAVSLTMSSIKKLRWYNLFGAAIFSFYGFAIGALPVGLLNLFIVVADIYYIYKMYSLKESFMSVFADVNDPYLNYLLEFYQSDIHQFFPNFDLKIFKNDPEKNFIFLLLRNAKVAGIFMGIKNENVLSVHLDFVTIEYRDMKPGDFIYKKNIQLMKENGIEVIECTTENKTHRNYLIKMGFELKYEDSIFVKDL